MIKLPLKQRVIKCVKKESYTLAGIAVLLLVLLSESIADLVTTGVL
jgi:hypothetical protein